MGTGARMDRELNTQVFIRSGACISALGANLDEAWEMLLKNTSGLSLNLGNWEGRISNLEGNRFNELLDQLLKEIVLNEQNNIANKDTQVIISTTKANIEDLPANAFAEMTSKVQSVLQLSNEPIVVSNACISGIIAINLAADLIKSGSCNRVIVIGIDVLSEFVTTGFKALFALSNSLCKPYDKQRKGINLGEAGAYVVLSNIKDAHSYSARFLSGASSNDANHISGPSRTGEGLYRAIHKSIERAEINSSAIDFIQAHGTATLYNDEMESIALGRLDLEGSPSNSFKAYIGHTLGAAGVIETIFSLKCLEEDMLIKSLGYEEHGLGSPMNIITKNRATKLSTILKSGSGFGGCNAAFIIQKIESE